MLENNESTATTAAATTSSDFRRHGRRQQLLWPAAFLLGVVVLLSARNVSLSLETAVASGGAVAAVAAASATRSWVPSLAECNDNGGRAAAAGDQGESAATPNASHRHRLESDTAGGPFLWGAAAAAPPPRGPTEHADNDDAGSTGYDDECWIAFQHIRQINDCYRISSAGAGRDAATMVESCATHHNLSQPVLNWAWYAGQGYGRLVEHSVNTCLVAATVGRPCLVDMTERDPYHIFRSFISSTLDVEVDMAAYGGGDDDDDNNNDGSSVLSRAASREILDALSRLPELHNGHWTAKHLDGTEYRYVLPLFGKEGSRGPSPPTPLQQLLSHPEKVAISPNWGSSWFGKRGLKWPPLHRSLSSSSSTPSRTCLHTDPRMATYMQNYMYRPTALARGLHRKYHRKVMRGVINDTVAAYYGTNRPNAKIPPYGAVQLRFFILRQEGKFPDSNQDTDTIQGALYKMALDLFACLRGQQIEAAAKADLSPTSTFIQRWWIVTDTIGLGKNLTDMLNQMAAATDGGDIGGKNSTDGRNMEFFIDDSSLTSTGSAGDWDTADEDDPIDRINRHRVGGEVPHSMAKESVGPMGHEYMASSIIDWMVLHESKMALVTAAYEFPVGAFGATGARGRGKVELSNAETHGRCNKFVIFARQRRPSS